MDWLKESLKKAGVDEAKAGEIVGEINKELPKHFIPKDKYNEAIDARKKAETDIAERDKQLEELKKTAGMSDELKKQIETLQNENKSAKEKYEADLKDLTLNSAIKAALSGKAHDETLVAGLVDRTKLVIDGEKIVGLDEQLKTLQESKAFLFKSSGGTGAWAGGPGFRVGGTGGNNTGTASNEVLDSIFGIKKN